MRLMRVWFSLHELSRTMSPSNCPIYATRRADGIVHASFSTVHSNIRLYFRLDLCADAPVAFLEATPHHGRTLRSKTPVWLILKP